MNRRRILKNKWFLYLTEFFSGVSLMAVELGASRLLAPYFSSSQIVWTIIIGTIMIAMALGNVWGGRSADRDPDPDRLYRRILFAAVWIACIPLLGKYVIAGITVALALFVTKNFLVWAAFAACLVLFVCPLLILGTVTPSLVKYTVDSLEDSGKAVGTMEALNTIGSIIGTFLYVACAEWWLRGLDNGQFLFIKAPGVFRSGFRMVVFSVIIMVVVLFFRKGIMGNQELPQKLRSLKAHLGKKKEAAE